MIDIEQLCKDAVARFKAMPLAEQQEMCRAQRKSWVIGEMMLEHPEMTREYVERLYFACSVKFCKIARQEASTALDYIALPALLVYRGKPVPH